MSYTVVKKEKGVVDVNLILPAEEIDKAWDQALTRLGKSIDVPGFRAGSAPSNIILERVGTGRVYNEIASDLVTRELSRILKGEGLAPIDNPQIKINQLEKGKEFQATITFSQKPKVAVNDWRSVRVKKAAIKEVSEADVEQSLDNIFKAWKKRTESQRPQGDESKIEEDKGKLVSDSSQGGEDGAGKSQAFIYDASGNKIFVEEKQSLPDEQKNKGSNKDEINDDFARQIGAKDLSHLRELVKTDLITASERAVEREFENRLFDKLIEITKVETPEVLIEDEINRMLVSLSQEVQSVGMNLEDYLKREGKSIDDLKKGWRAQAEKNVTLQLALDEIAHELGITITEEELVQSLADTDQSKLTDDQKASLVRYMTFALIQSKTLSQIKKSALGEGVEKPKDKGTEKKS